MRALPTRPMSLMQQRPTEILTLLRESPVILAQRSHGTAILCDIDQWNRLIERLEDLEDIVDALETKLDIATGKAELMTQTEIDEWLAEDEAVPA